MSAYAPIAFGTKSAPSRIQTAKGRHTVLSGRGSSRTRGRIAGPGLERVNIGRDDMIIKTKDYRISRHWEVMIGSLNKRWLHLILYWNRPNGSEFSLRKFSNYNHRCYCPVGHAIDGKIRIHRIGGVVFWYSYYPGPVPCHCDKVIRLFMNQKKMFGGKQNENQS